MIMPSSRRSTFESEVSFPDYRDHVVDATSLGQPSGTSEYSDYEYTGGVGVPSTTERFSCGVADKTPNKRRNQPEKIVVDCLSGEVDSVRDSNAYVTMTTTSGECIEAVYPADDLLAYGISAGDAFVCRFVQQGSGYWFEFERVTELRSQPELDSLAAQFDDLLSGGEFD